MELRACTQADLCTSEYMLEMDKGTSVATILLSLHQTFSRDMEI